MDEFVVAIIAAVVIMMMIFVPIIMITEQFSYWNGEAEIEQLRTDLEKVSVQESEDVIGQVTQWNQTIAKKRRFNDMLFLCLFIPNGWDQIEMLEIPSR